MKKYNIIYADPPWSFNNKAPGAACDQYSVMSLDDLKNLPISNLADDNCILFMWWVASQPVEAISLVQSWGFEIKTMTGFNWVKKTKTGKNAFGLGYWTRQSSECCLIAVRGKVKKISSSIRAVMEWENEGHSIKPDIFRHLICDLIGYELPKIELFAREKATSWDVFGNEVLESIDILKYYE